MDNFIHVWSCCGKWYASNMSMSQHNPPDVSFEDAVANIMMDDTYGYPEHGRYVSSTVPIAKGSEDAILDYLSALEERVGLLSEYGAHLRREPYEPSQENRQLFRNTIKEL